MILNNFELGLICSNCLTLRGSHKGHDAMPLTDFFMQVDNIVSLSKGTK